MTLNFIDISNWQRGLDLANVPNLDGVIVKATEGVGYVDPSCDVFYQQAKRLGKKLGFYHFAGASRSKCLLDAEAEWAFFRDNTKNYAHEAIPVLDYEPFGYSNADFNWVRTWVNACHRDWGVWPVVYMAGSHAVAAASVIPDVQKNCGLWYAGGASYNTRYTSFVTPTPPPSNGWNVFGYQYSSNGAMGGTAPLDINIAYVDGASWDAYARGDGKAAAAPAPAPAPNPVAAPTVSGSVTYTVQPGDTLSGIAARYGTTWQALQAANGIANANVIYPGQRLTIRGGGVAPSGQTYTVRAGDTLSGIAAKYGTTWQRLQQINGIPDANVIHPGQILKIG